MAAHSFESGALVAGRYQLGARLGAGGFGVVFRALDIKLRREVAVKLLHHGTRDRTMLQRFYREIELARQLSHPNTVRLYEFGETETGVPFIAWELLRGCSLDQLIKRERRLGDERAARIGVQILKSLMEAHALGIVHRDIKPANVFLCEYAGEPDFVKVLDFGIATLEAHEGRSALTEEGMTVGTPPYMAPEQVLQLRTDARTDLYALGLVLAEAVSGQRVYADRVSLRVCMEQASPAPVPLPHTVVMSRLGPVIKRATQKRPEARHASAAEMLAELEAAMGGAPLPSAPVERAPLEIAASAVPTLPAPLATMPLTQPATVIPLVTPPPKPRRAWIIGAAAAGIFVTAAVGGWMFPYVLAAFDESSRGKPAKRAKPRPIHSALAGFRISGVDAQNMLEQLAESGWERSDPSHTTNEAFTSVQYGLHKDSRSGMVIFYMFTSEERARAVEGAIQEQPVAAARERERLLTVKLSDKAASRALLERLLRR